MSIIDELITNRTKADVDRWLELKNKGFARMTADEREEWFSGLIGSYTPTNDMNRVGEAINYLAQLFNNHGHAVAVNPKTDWALTDIPTDAQLNQYLADIQALRNEALGHAFPDVPATMYGITHEDANHIEETLVILEEVVTMMFAAFRHCGVTICGMEGYFI